MKLKPVAWQWRERAIETSPWLPWKFITQADYDLNCKAIADGIAPAWRNEMRELYDIPDGYVAVPREPVEKQWGHLARDIMFVLRQERPTPKKLFYHLEHLYETVPQWIRDEQEMHALDHVISKGTCCVLIYKAMLAAENSHDNDD